MNLAPRALLCAVPATLLALALHTTAAGAAEAASASPLATTLTAVRITHTAEGRDTREPAHAVKPGDTLQYSARYRNAGRAALADVVATLPVPAGTQLVAGSAQPERALASTDGATFEPVPLTRRVRASDGQWTTVLVPLAEYRALRWPARPLAAGQSFEASLRVQVVDAAVVAKVTR
jgi:uncharacterized repeat protein (TIGR01451 family)